MPPQTIDEVLTELDQIIHRARNEQDRLGFFATLYRNVTIKIKEGIAAGLFEVARGEYDQLNAGRSTGPQTGYS